MFQISAGQNCLLSSENIPVVRSRTYRLYCDKSRPYWVSQRDVFFILFWYSISTSSKKVGVAERTLKQKTQALKKVQPETQRLRDRGWRDWELTTQGRSCFGSTLGVYTDNRIVWWMLLRVTEIWNMLLCLQLMLWVNMVAQGDGFQH